MYIRKLWKYPLPQYADLQTDLTNIKKLTMDSKILLNDAKFIVLHIRKNNPMLNHSFGPTEITSVSKQNDKRFTITPDLYKS